MNLFAAAMLVLLTVGATSADACLPPPPGMVEPPPPTKEAKAKGIFNWSTDIVYGVVTSDPDDKTRFKVLHVYKGTLKRGQIIEPNWSVGFDAPPCASMMGGWPPAFRGTYGVIAYRDSPELSFVDDKYLQEMFLAKLIVSARR